METQRVVSIKQFNPYDLNEIAEVDRVIKQRPLQKVQQGKSKNQEKHKIKRGILNPKNNDKK